MKPIVRIVEEIALDRVDVPSQVSVPERQVLKFLTSKVLPAAKTIVDLGSGAGSAALAMAEGCARSGGAFPTIHCYDWFSVGMGHYATQKFKALSRPDDQSFLSDFEHFLAPYLSHVEVHSGDIKTETWSGGDIDLLFVDICKDEPIFNHVAKEFFPSLKPGSILVHQDFSRPRLPWLHYSAGFMAQILTPLCRTGGSVFYRVKERPSAYLIAAMTDSDLPISVRRYMARLGVELARPIDKLRSDHFVCLAEMVDIYIDHRYGNPSLAASRVVNSKSKARFAQYYPDMVAEVVRGARHPAAAG